MRVVQAALSQLVVRGFIRVDVTDEQLHCSEDLPDDLTPLEQALCARARAGTTVTRVLRESADLASVEREMCERWGLTTVTRFPWISLTVPALALLKICVGVARDRPVGFLVASLLLSLILAPVVFAARTHATVLGSAVEARLRERHLRLRRGISHSDAAHVALAMALFGIEPFTKLDQRLFGPLQAIDNARNTLAVGSRPNASEGGGDSGCGGGGSDGGCGGCGG
jgi:uncharacterized protein (TIGR04222 family)